MIKLSQKTAPQIAKETAEKIRKIRRQKKLTQEALAKKSGLSFASYKRFEQTGQISFESLIKLAIALDMEDDFDALFVKHHFSSLEEMIESEKD